VLRFWETKFARLNPLKRAGGRRYYRPEDVALLRYIRQCLYRDGYTIRGVQTLLAGTEAPPARPAADAGLFPAGLLPAHPPAEAPPSPMPARAPARAPAGAPDRLEPRKAALEDISRELREARALMERLTRKQG
jgi:DNA-binding transcriptional MerR regulator